MIQSISHYFSEKLASNSEEQEVLQYGFECLINTLIPTIFYFLFALAQSMIFETIIWLVLFLLLRNIHNLLPLNKIIISVSQLIKKAIFLVSQCLIHKNYMYSILMSWVSCYQELTTDCIRRFTFYAWACLYTWQV